MASPENELDITINNVDLRKEGWRSVVQRDFSLAPARRSISTLAMRRTGQAGVAFGNPVYLKLLRSRIIRNISGKPVLPVPAFRRLVFVLRRVSALRREPATALPRATWLSELSWFTCAGSAPDSGPQRPRQAQTARPLASAYDRRCDRSFGKRFDVGQTLAWMAAYSDLILCG